MEGMQPAWECLFSGFSTGLRESFSGKAYNKADCRRLTSLASSDNLDFPSHQAWRFHDSIAETIYQQKTRFVAEHLPPG